MKIFALDTSTDTCSVALLDNSEGAIRIIAKIESVPNKHAKVLLEMVDALLHEARINFEEVNVIAYGSGPGSFTGLRIASAAVQALTYAWKIPSVPVSTLQALAYYGNIQYKITNIITAIDARKNEVYFNSFSFDPDYGLTSLKSDIVCSPSLCPQFGYDSWIGIGSGWREYGELLLERSNCPAHTIDFDARPQASSIAQLAYKKLLQGQKGNFDLALPVYLRNEVV